MLILENEVILKASYIFVTIYETLVINYYIKKTTSFKFHFIVKFEKKFQEENWSVANGNKHNLLTISNISSTKTVHILPIQCVFTDGEGTDGQKLFIK